MAMVRCPVCGRAELHREKRKSELYGFELGEYMAEVCPHCGNIFWQGADVRKMEAKAKRLGIWGLEQRTKVALAGNSLVVRVPKRIARFVGLKKGEVVSLHPVGRDKLIIEETASESSK